MRWLAPPAASLPPGEPWRRAPRRSGRLLAALLAAGATVACHAPGSGAPPGRRSERTTLKIFLLLGQSNMAGRGALGPGEAPPAHPRVKALDRNDRWMPAVDPIHFDKPSAGVGPGTSFGWTVADAIPGAVVGLVPCAVGGSSIDQWSSRDEGGLYEEALRRARIALRDGELAGILWHQGESDAANADAYARKATALFADIRRDLGAPDVPIVVGTIGDFYRGGGPINRAIRSLSSIVPRSALVDATGLAHKGDQVHFDTPSARELGRRYARAWLDLTREPDRRRPPPSNRSPQRDRE